MDLLRLDEGRVAERETTHVKRLKEYGSLDQLLSDCGVVVNGSYESTTARLFERAEAKKRRCTDATSRKDARVAALHEQAVRRLEKGRVAERKTTHVKRLKEYGSLDQLLSDYGVVVNSSYESTTARLFERAVAKKRSCTNAPCRVDEALRSHLRERGVSPLVVDFYAALSAWMGAEMEDRASGKVPTNLEVEIKLTATDESKRHWTNTKEAVRRIVACSADHAVAAKVAEQLIMQSLVFGLDSGLSGMFVLFVSAFQKVWGHFGASFTKHMAGWMNISMIAFLRMDLSVSDQDAGVAACMVLTSLCATEQSVLSESFGLALCTLQITLRVLKWEQNEFKHHIYQLLDHYEDLALGCFFLLGIHSGTNTAQKGRSSSRNNHYAYQELASSFQVTELTVKAMFAWENTQQLTHVYDMFLSCIDTDPVKSFGVMRSANTSPRVKTWHQMLFQQVQNSPSWALSEVVPDGLSSSLETRLKHSGVALWEPCSFDHSVNANVSVFVAHLLSYAGIVENDMTSFYKENANGVSEKDVSICVMQEIMGNFVHSFWKDFGETARPALAKCGEALCESASALLLEAVGLGGDAVISDLFAQLLIVACTPKLCQYFELIARTVQWALHRAFTTASAEHVKAFKAGVGWYLFDLNGLRAANRGDQKFPKCDFRPSRAVVALFSMHMVSSATLCVSIVHEDFQTTLYAALVCRLQTEFDVLRHWEQPSPSNAVVQAILDRGLSPLLMYALRLIASDPNNNVCSKGRLRDGLSCEYKYATLSARPVAGTEYESEGWTNANRLKTSRLGGQAFTFSHVYDHTSQHLVDAQKIARPSLLEAKNSRHFLAHINSSAFGTRAIDRSLAKGRKMYEQEQAKDREAEAAAAAEALIATEDADAARRADKRAEDAAKREATRRMDKKNKETNAAAIAEAKANAREKSEAEKARHRDEAKRSSSEQKKRQEEARQAAFERAQAKTKVDELTSKAERGVAARAVEEAARARTQTAEENAAALEMALAESEANAANASATAAREEQELQEAIARSLNAGNKGRGGRRVGGRGGRGKPAPLPPPPPMDDESMCVVCLDEVRAMVVVPCGHRCLCFSCGKQPPAQCPLCRGPATSVIRVFG